MLRNLPAALQALGVLVLTGWVGAYLVLSTDTPPHGGDIDWAFFLGVGLVVANIVLGLRSVQTRVPFLRSPSYELGKVVTRWHSVVRQLDALATDDRVPAALWADLCGLDADTDRVLRKHFEDWRPFYDHGVEPFHDGAASHGALQGANVRYYFLRTLLNNLHGARQHGILS